MAIDVNEELKKLRQRYEKLQKEELSEIDTQILLIEPVLKIAGWDLLEYNQVRRASRNSRKQEFDIEIYQSIEKPLHVTIAIECKCLNSGEFNIKKLDSQKGIGQLEPRLSNKNWDHMQTGDGIGQLRKYCMNIETFLKASDRSIAVLTNGQEWIIFDRAFTDELRVREPISKEHIKAQAKLTEDFFVNKIIKPLSCIERA